MNIRRLSIAASLAVACLMSQAVRAASYFVDALEGRDSHSGLAESEAWQTIDRVNHSTFPTGSTIYLKRDSVWREQLVVGSSGLTIDAYGTGAPPTLDSSAPVSGWQAEDGGIYSQTLGLAPVSGALGNVSENGTMMSPAPWAGSAARSLKKATPGSFTFDSSTGRLYIKPANAPDDKVYLASTLRFGILAEDKSDIVVQNLDIRRPSLHGIAFNNCTRCSVRDSRISQGGGAIVQISTRKFVYAGNGVEYSGQSEGGMAERLHIADMFDAGVSPQAFVPNSRLSGITIRNSIIERCGLAGVEISALATGKTSTLSDITLSGLNIRDSGRGWSGNRYGSTGHGILVQASHRAGTMSGIAVHDSSIVNSMGDGVRLSGEVGTVDLDRLSLERNHHGVNASTRTLSRSMKLLLGHSLIFANRSFGVVYSSASAAGFNLVRNSFHDNGAINLAIYRQKGQALLRDNIFASSAPMRQVYVDRSNTLRGPDIDHNCYVAAPHMIQYRKLVYAALAPFTAATGFEFGGVEVSDALFKNPAARDFELQDDSPCVGRGANRGPPS